METTKGKTRGSKVNNLVAKYAREFNKAHVMKDRKKASKCGYKKHRGRGFDHFTKEGIKQNV